MTMKISVVIPAYNEELFLAKTIEAVLAQTYPDFEVIIVNNMSTDNTEIIARRYPVRIITETRKGLLYAREAGRRAATGQLIANIDADCLPRPDWLPKAARIFDNPRVVAVSGPYDYYDGGIFFRYILLLTQTSLYWLVNYLLNLFQYGAILIGGNNIIRTSTLTTVGGYNTKIIFYGEDTDTAKRVARQGRVVFSNKLVMPTSARRFHSEGMGRIIIRYFYHFSRVLCSA